MFGKSKKTRELQEIQEARASREKKIDASIEEAIKIKDPAKKILELDKVRNEINNEYWTEKSIIFKKSDKAFSRVAGTSFVAAVGGGTAAAVATLATGGVGLFVAFPILIGGIVAGAKRSDSVRKKLNAEVQDHLNNTEAQLVRVTKLIEAEVSSKVEEISTSPLKEKVLGLPGIAAHFSKAAAKLIATEETPEQANDNAAPAAAKTQKKPAAPRRKRQKPDYKNLNGL